MRRLGRGRALSPMDIDSSSVPQPSGPPQNSRSVSANPVCACAMPPRPSRYLRAPRTSFPVRRSSRSACAPRSFACDNHDGLAPLISLQHAPFCRYQYATQQ